MANFEGINIIDYRWSPKLQEMRDFLGRNQVPYRWLDINNEKARNSVKDTGCDSQNLPLVVFPDGSSLTKPTNEQIANKIELKMHAERPCYEVIVVGGGPAGLSTAVHAASEGLRTLLIERHDLGGQAVTIPRLDNYLGFPEGLSGGELIQAAITQAKQFGVEILTQQEVTSIRVEEPYRFVTLADGTEHTCYTLVISTGVNYRHLDVPNIDALNGAGVYYGVAMSASACRDEEIFIVGAGNGAGESALSFSEYARSVTILVRGDSLDKMASYLLDQIKTTDKIRVEFNSSVVEVKGEKNLEAITIGNTKTNEKQTLPATKLFIMIGSTACTNCFTGIVERNDKGFIMTGSDLIHDESRPDGWTLDREPFLLETNVPGIFVVGDVRYNSIKRVASAAGAGSVVVHFIHEYLKQI